jgi:hypothetical protein
MENPESAAKGFAYFRWPKPRQLQCSSLPMLAKDLYVPVGISA